jgi:hypothetical protein
MAIVLTRDIPVDDWKNPLVQRGYVESSGPFDCSRDAGIRAECRNGLGDAHEVAKASVWSKAHEHVNVIGQDGASQHGR